MTSTAHSETCREFLENLRGKRHDIDEVRESLRSISDESSAAMTQFIKLRDECVPSHGGEVKEEEDVSRLISQWRLLCVPCNIDPTTSTYDLVALTRTLYENMVKLNRLREAVKLKDEEAGLSLSKACKYLSGINEPALELHENHRYVDSHGELIGIAASILDIIQMQTQILYQGWLNLDLAAVLSEEQIPSEALLARSPSSSGPLQSQRRLEAMRHALTVYLKLVSHQPNYFDGLLRDGVIKSRGRYWRRNLNDALVNQTSAISSSLAWLNTMLRVEQAFAQKYIYQIIRSSCFCVACGTGFDASPANGVHDRSVAVDEELIHSQWGDEQSYINFLIDNELRGTLEEVFACGIDSSQGDSVSDTLINILTLTKLIQEQTAKAREILGPKAELLEMMRRIQQSISDAYDNQLDDICSRIQKVSHANLFISPIVVESLTLIRRLKEIAKDDDLVNMTCDRILNILIKVSQRNEHTVIERIVLYDYIAEHIKELQSPFYQILRSLVSELSEQFATNAARSFLATYNLNEYVDDEFHLLPASECAFEEDKLFSRLYLFFQSTSDRLLVPELSKLRERTGVAIYKKIQTVLSEVFRQLHAQLSEPYRHSLPNCFLEDG